ncbi:PREDICTED: leucine-rich repeat-containing protein 75A [Tinamus guttatus]|uniref:leucine-rich repeat-containing protein 75A n=1 Tax=Tinamus guttatus TaxID=94827 RepID=UPI00052F255F|nr:PREDICTED: leucine-rich repeat-containing protein 75A [Tinamus guttatus]
MSHGRALDRALGHDLYPRAPIGAPSAHRTRGIQASPEQSSVCRGYERQGGGISGSSAPALRGQPGDCGDREAESESPATSQDTSAHGHPAWAQRRAQGGTEAPCAAAPQLGAGPCTGHAGGTTRGPAQDSRGTVVTGRQRASPRPPARTPLPTVTPRGLSAEPRAGRRHRVRQLRSSEPVPARDTLAPYHRRVCLIQDMLLPSKQGRQEEATELLRHLRQDLGMESTSLDDVLYRYASFRNLVDPITHDLIISLARYIHCPKPEGEALGAMEKLCRQLTYHLSPHSQWRRHGLVRRKPQACAAHVDAVELCFTDLTEEMLLQLLPALGALPRLTTLSLNGNRLTKAVLRDLTEALKDPARFPSVTWIDLGNNVDIFSLPQPFLVGLKKRCPKQGNLPTILEFAEGQPGEPEGPEGSAESHEEPQGLDRLDLRPMEPAMLGQEAVAAQT